MWPESIVIQRREVVDRSDARHSRTTKHYYFDLVRAEQISRAAFDKRLGFKPEPRIPMQLRTVLSHAFAALARQVHWQICPVFLCCVELVLDLRCQRQLLYFRAW